MKILYPTPECTPFANAGGVGVVPRYLLPALANLGLDVAAVMPRHGCIPSKYVPNAPEFNFTLPWDGRQEPVRVFRGCLPDAKIAVWFIDNPTHFSGHSIYTFDQIPFESDVRRYSFFAKAGLELIRRLNPDVVHVNDWTGGYILGWMELANREAASAGRSKPFPQRRILTIHNIGYQGQTWKGRLAHTGFQDLAEHPVIGPLFEDPRPEYDCVNPMRLAMELADGVNAVSPTNADEITRPPNPDAYFVGGQGLERIAQRLKAEGRLCGILNGMYYPNNRKECAA